MGILDNELVRKYFGCGLGDHAACDGMRNDCRERTSFRVLRAMQEPIKKGEKVLGVWHAVDFSSGITEIKEEIYPKDMLGRWHPDTLRLPEIFQAVGTPCVSGCQCICHLGVQAPAMPDCCKCWYPKHACPCSCHQPPLAAEKCECVEQHGAKVSNGQCELHDSEKAVEAKIRHLENDIYDNRFKNGIAEIDRALRELVELVRKS